MPEGCSRLFYRWYVFISLNLLFRKFVSLGCVVCYDFHVFELYICKRHLLLVIFQRTCLTEELAHLLRPIYCFLKEKN